MEMVETLQERISSAARSYRNATVRYLMKPPLSLKPKYVAFLLDLAHQSDHIQQVLSRGADRIASDAEQTALALILRAYCRDERGRMQLVLADLRKLGYTDDLPERPMTSGDAAMRAYSNNISYERPAALLGILLVFLGVSAEISPIVIRLLGVGSVPKEAMRWLTLRESSDSQALHELLNTVSERIHDPQDQASLIEAVEVTGELLALGAGSRTVST